VADPARRSGGAELGLRLLLVVGSLLISLFAAELLLRAAGYVPVRFRPRARVLGLDSPLVLDCFPTNPRGYFDIDLRLEATRARYDALLAARPDFDVARTPYAVEFRYNARGFRGPEIAPKPDGRKRVIVLGDSFTEGEGVREADVYPRVIERLWNARHEQTVEVVNAGRRGADFPELFRTFEQLVSDAPDLTIYAMVLNDAERSKALDSHYPAMNDWVIDRRASVSGALAPRFFDWRLVAFFRDRLETRRVSQQSLRWYQDLHGDANAAGWQRTLDQISRMNAIMRERGGRFLVVLWPLLVDLDGRYPLTSVHENVARAIKSREIPFVDLLDALRGRDPRGLWVHPVDLHPNEIAHRVAAETLLPHVENGLRPAP
jgi:lysophospholipase L1-like esterase